MGLYLDGLSYEEMAAKVGRSRKIGETLCRGSGKAHTIS
jgi:hypothetical protein